MKVIDFARHSFFVAAGVAFAGSALAAGFGLRSPDIPAGGSIPKSFEFAGFGCSGENRSPVLEWSGAPQGTKSYAITAYDPDAPTGSGWWHWVVIDIPASAQGLAANAGEEGGKKLPAGARQHRNDYGVSAWGGTCPPVGDKAHRYIFTVHALKVQALELPANPSTALVGYMINTNSIDRASFTATYGRPRLK